MSHDEEDYADVDIRVREEWLLEGHEPLAEHPCLVQATSGEQRGIALKWFGVAEPKMGGNKKRQFFFPVLKPDIPEWETIELSEWCVTGIGTRQNLKEKFPKISELRCEPTDWLLVIAVNHSLSDLQGNEMYGRPYFIPVVTRIIGSGEMGASHHVAPEEYFGEVRFRPVQIF